MPDVDAITQLADRIMQVFEAEKIDMVSATAAMAECEAFLFLYDVQGDKTAATQLSVAHHTMVKELIQLGLSLEEDN